MIKQLKNWLKKPDNSAAKLATILGYQSQSTIYNWIKRKRIPLYVVSQLKKALK